MDSGGGIIENSTISGNTASFGGGVYFNGGNWIINSTITGNTGTASGGGVFLGFTTIATVNSVFAGNTGGSCAGVGSLSSSGHNIESQNTCGFTDPTDQVNTDPMLGLLADNGGPTLTHALDPASPAIDAGDSTICAGADVNGVDQRGFPRPSGACDIGAYEDMTLYALTLATTGTGGGSATSSPGKIDCPGTCSDQIGDGTVVTLTATPDSNSVFSAWSGDADCSDGQVTMTADTSCTATFSIVQYTLTVNVSPSGGGSVTDNGTLINCPGDCTEAVDDGTGITLTATPVSGYSFSNWTNCDSPSGSQCTMTMNSDKSVTAVFVAPDITVSSTSIDFGSVTENTTSAQTVTITNDGNDNLNIGSIAGTDTLAVPYSIVNDLCSNQPLTPTSNYTFDVEFAPTTTGTFNDTFDIPSNDPDESSVPVSLTGTGTAAPVPNISVTDSMGSANDYQMPFPDTTEGVTSSAETVTISNTGAADLNVTNIQLTGTNTGGFSLDLSGGVNPCATAIKTIPSNNSCTVTVAFNPTTTGSMSAALMISSDDTDEPTVNVALTGTGLSAAGNNAPTKPELVFPANGQQGLGTTVTFKWKPSTDPDGDPVSYDIYYCIDSDPLNNCTPTQVASLDMGTSGTYYAGLGGDGSLWFILSGLIFAGILIRFRKKGLLVTLMLLMVAFTVVSCGSGGGDNNHITYTATGLSSDTTYHWAVVAKDDRGGSTPSDTWSFKTRK